MYDNLRLFQNVIFSPCWESITFCHLTSTELKHLQMTLHKTLFQVSLASGLWVSQIAAQYRNPSLLKFSRDGSKVSLTPSPSFLAKNEFYAFPQGPVFIPAWLQISSPHPLCPFNTLHRWLWVSLVSSDSLLFIWPDSQWPMMHAIVL